MNPYTRQVALTKGFALAHNAGTLNFSIEHAKSFTDITSPHTAYSRNILSTTYNKVFRMKGSSLNLTAGLTGNIGGYNSEADPDAFRDTYQRQRDNQLRANMMLDWLYNSRSSGVFNITLQAAFSTADRRSDNNTNTSSSSTQASLHTTTNGYARAASYLVRRDTGMCVRSTTRSYRVYNSN